MPRTNPDVMSVIDSLDDDMATLMQPFTAMSLSEDASVRHDDVICTRQKFRTISFG